MRGRNWCFRVSNPEGILLPERWDDVRICVWQLELSESGLVHYQGYVEFTVVKRRVAVKSQEGLAGCWCAPREGSKAQAIAYASKDETQLEATEYWPDEASVNAIAERGGDQGARNDIHALATGVKAGLTNTELFDLHGGTFMKYHRGVEAGRLAMPAQERIERPKDCIIYWGPTGTGKSWRLAQECPEGTEWFWASEGKWFDGYEGQPGIVFDEIRDNWYQFSFLLKLLSNYPRRNESKGGVLRMQAYKFRMSSNIHPKRWYGRMKGRPNSPWLASPLRRRFSEIIKMDVPVAVHLQGDCIDDDEPSSEELLVAPFN